MHMFARFLIVASTICICLLVIFAQVNNIMPQPGVRETTAVRTNEHNKKRPGSRMVLATDSTNLLKTSLANIQNLQGDDAESSVSKDSENNVKHVTYRRRESPSQLVEKPAGTPIKIDPYPSWWERAWARSATNSLHNDFVGDQPFFPPCTEQKGSKGYYNMVEPFNYLPNTKNPCWYDNPQQKRGLRCIPYFYVAGVAKCGTTDLYRRIRLHPEVMKGTMKEYHWWDRGRYGDIEFDGPRARAMPFKEYTDQVTGKLGIKLVQEDIESDGTSVKIFGDGSPSYLWDIHYWNLLNGNQGCLEPRVIIGQHIRHVYPNAKIILTFRHPTPRLYSRFLSRIPRTPSLKHATADTFHKLVSRGVVLYRECFERWSVRHCAYNVTLFDDAFVRLVEGMYPVFMADWLRVFPLNQILILRYEDYAKDLEGQMKKVFQFLGLGPVNSTVMAEVIEHDKVNVGSLYDELGPMIPETADILNDFYEPFIDKFAEILNDQRFLWRDIDHL